MKKLITKKTLFLSIALLFSYAFFAFAKAEDKPVAPSVKKDLPIEIRIIEGRRVVAESAEGKEVDARLGQQGNKLEAEIKKLDQEIEKELAELRGRARTVDPETLEKDQEKILKKKKERDMKAETSQEEFKRTVTREGAKFNKKIQDTIVETAKKKGWDLVAIKETGEVVYVSDRLNGTDEIISILDNVFKADKKVTK